MSACVCRITKDGAERTLKLLSSEPDSKHTCRSHDGVCGKTCLNSQHCCSTIINTILFSFFSRLISHWGLVFPVSYQRCEEKKKGAASRDMEIFYLPNRLWGKDVKQDYGHRVHISLSTGHPQAAWLRSDCTSSSKHLRSLLQLQGSPTEKHCLKYWTEGWSAIQSYDGVHVHNKVWVWNGKTKSYIQILNSAK